MNQRYQVLDTILFRDAAGHIFIPANGPGERGILYFPALLGSRAFYPSAPLIGQFYN